MRALRRPAALLYAVIAIACVGIVACGLSIAGTGASDDVSSADANASDTRNDTTLTADAFDSIDATNGNDDGATADANEGDDASDADKTGTDAGTDGAIRDANVDDAFVDGCAPSPTGIIGWWTGDGTMVDRIGGNNGVSGTQNGGTTVKYAAGEVGQAFDFTNGTNPYVQVTSAATIDINGPLTMEAWVYSNNFGGRIVDKQTAGGSDGYMIDTFNGYPRIIISGVDLSGPNKLPTNAWVHEAGTWDGTTMRLYVNGVEVANQNATPLPHNAIALRFGADSNGQSHFDGLIDEVAIYNRALAVNEILAIVNAGKSGRCK